MNAKTYETGTEFRVTWQTQRINPKFVRGLRGSHREIITVHKSEIFATIEEARAFRATVKAADEDARIKFRRPGNQNFIGI